MIITHLPAAQFVSKPWKNGLGTTHDMFLWPQGADHTTLALRCAVSPIVTDNEFSSFPGVERVITLIEGSGLDLKFADTTVNLQPHEGHRFDSGLTPIGHPIGGPVSVINVMARTETWTIAQCEIATERDQHLSNNDLLFVYAIDETVLKAEDQQVVLPKGDALLATGNGMVQWTSSTAAETGDTGGVLFARFSPITENDSHT